MKKRILALALALTLAGCLLCACTPAANNDPVVDPTKSDADDKPGVSYGVMDQFKGEVFYLDNLIPKTMRDYTEEELEEMEGPVVFSAQTQLLADRVLEMEARYGIQIHAGAGGTGLTGTGADVAMGLAAGEILADAFHTQIDTGRDWFLGGAVAALDDLGEYIDLTDEEKWGSVDTLLACNYKGVTWGVPWHGSALSMCPYIAYGQLMLNLETFEQFEVEWTVQELDENHEWTYDTFLDIIPEISNTDEANKIFGFQYTPEFGICAVYANGGQKVEYDSAKGKYVYGLTSEKAKTALEWAGEVAKNYQYADANTSVTPFLKGESVIAMMNPNRIFGDVFSTTTNVQFVPFPYGPDVEYGTSYTSYITYMDSACGLFNTKNSDRIKATAMIFDEITDEFIMNDLGEDYQHWLFRNTWGKDEEGETAQQYSFNVYYDNGHNIRWDYCIELGAVNTSITNTLGKLSFTDAATVIDTLASFADQANNAIDASVNP